LFLGKPVVGPASGEEIESSTGNGQDVRPVPAYSLLQTPRFNGKPLDDHPDDDTDEGDDDMDDADEDNLGDENVSTMKPVAHAFHAHPDAAPKKTIRSLIREKRVSRPAIMF
jgi:hypothetical protein